jgi:DNA-binding transcriptional MerR regulator
MSDPFISAAAAAAMSGRTVRTVRRWAHAGKIRTARSESGHVTYSVRDLERLTDTTDTPRTPVRVEEAGAIELVKEANADRRELQAQVTTLAHRVGELEGENRVLREELARERSRVAALEQAPPTAPTLAEQAVPQPGFFARLFRGRRRTD